MKRTRYSERKHRQDILQRIDQRLSMLEDQAIGLLSTIDFESMKPNQRAQAGCRLLKLITRLLELYEECALSDDDYRTEFFRKLLISAMNEGELMLHDII